MDDWLGNHDCCKFMFLENLVVRLTMAPAMDRVRVFPSRGYLFLALPPLLPSGSGHNSHLWRLVPPGVPKVAD